MALAAPLAACLQSPPDIGAPSCEGSAGIAEISLGRDHGCARLDNGGVWCWGLNDQGQLGDGTRIDRNQASQVADLRDVVRVAAGQDHTCALRGDGTLWCWGSGSNGQLGDGREEDSETPVQVRLEDVTDMAMGDDFSCAVTGDGAVHCWGENEHGQGGPDFTEVQVSPVPIEIEGTAEAVVAGANHACALLAGGGVTCWGGADLGQLGDGTLAERGAGAAVPGIAGASAVVAGRDHTCAVGEDGSLWCWGSNEHHQLAFVGDNPDDGCDSAEGIPASCVPLDIDVGQAVTAAAAGVGHTCAVTSGGAVRCIGANDAGQLGGGGEEFTDSDTPVEVRIDGAVVAVAAGEAQSCALTAAHQAYCWGSNRSGQLAETAALITSSPTRVPGADGAVRLAAGAQHTCVELPGGQPACWGANDSGQLGDGTLQARSDPTPVTALAGDAVRIGPGEEHTCVINTAARVRCWGRNSHGELGPAAGGDLSLVAVTVDLGGDVGAVESGDEHACAVRTDGALYCWGSDSNGQLGNGPPETTGPVLVELPDVLEVACGDEHTCALDNSGQVDCWGANDSGQLGDNSTTDRPQPAASPVELGAAASQIAVGDDFSCAITAGAVLCWGENEFGQLGDGTTDPGLLPRPVELGGDALGLALGSEHACAIVTAGGGRRLRCWGRNDGGQLGDGTTESASTPVDVPLPGEPEEVAAGERHTCARVTVGEDQQVYCWGSDIDGRLGSGRTLYYASPPGPIQVCP